jgi:hypothetical protein
MRNNNLQSLKLSLTGHYWVITIKQNKPETLRVALQVNDAQVVVGILIQGDVPRVETESSSLQTTISGDFLRSLPMR